MNKKINYKRFEKKIKNIYPNITDRQAKIIIKQLFIFWLNIIENTDKLELTKK